MRKFGLIGFPLGHSFSKGFFAEKFLKEGVLDVSYENFPIETIEGVTDMIAKNSELKGFNITIPYKQQIFSYLNDIDAEAREIGAVNCVKISDNKFLKGYNTDAYGFERSLLSVIGNTRPDALVLGTGGASKAVEYVLRKLEISYKMVSRNADGEIYSYHDITQDIVNCRKLIINTTPLGMSPNIDLCPNLPYEAIDAEHILFDLVYNPSQTKFLELGRRRGAKVMNGLMMLICQAERSWEIWNNK